MQPLSVCNIYTIPWIPYNTPLTLFWLTYRFNCDNDNLMTILKKTL